ncbi:hypothetical protein M758_6G051700 [Ceratodon purpureus]|nr:hypothetical protein M758_6G051700 [Ceratodon purpureus]
MVHNCSERDYTAPKTMRRQHPASKEFQSWPWLLRGCTSTH